MKKGRDKVTIKIPRPLYENLGKIIEGITVLLVEHHMELIMGISDEVVVLNYGKIISEGPPSKIKNDRNVIDAYLGEEIDYA